MKGLAVLVGLAVFLVGCSLAPHHQRPESPVPTTYPNQTLTTYDVRTGDFTAQLVGSNQLAAGDGNPADIAWQSFFLDPQLRVLIGLALNNNRNLQVAIARMEQAEAVWGIQRGQMFPQLGAALAGARQRGTSPASPTSNVISSQYTAGIAVTAFELDLFGRLRNLSEAAFQQYLASAEGARNVQISLVADTAIQFFRLRMAEVMLQLTNETLKSRKASFDLVSARFKAGVSSEMDVMQAKALMDASAAELAQFTRERAQAQNALVVLIGQPLPVDLPTPLPFASIDLLGNIPVGLPSDLLTRRPDIRAAENRLRAANANIGAARAAFLPNISLTGSMGTASTSLNNLFGSGSSAWSFVPTISVPIFTGGSLQAQLAQATAAQKEAVAAYQQTVEQAFREVSDALAGEGTLGTQFAARSAQKDASQRFLDLSNARFFNGVDSFIEVQIAEVQLYTSRLQQVRAGFETLANRVNLYKALGGGWDDAVPGAMRGLLTGQAKESNHD